MTAFKSINLYTKHEMVQMEQVTSSPYIIKGEEITVARYIPIDFFSRNLSSFFDSYITSREKLLLSLDKTIAKF